MAQQWSWWIGWERIEVSQRKRKERALTFTSFSLWLKNICPGAAVNASERRASQSLKVADDPGGGLLFRLWLHRPKARLWFYEFAWISCSSSRPLAHSPPSDDQALRGISWGFTHSSYIILISPPAAKKIAPLMQLVCDQEIQLAFLESVNFNIFFPLVEKLTVTCPLDRQRRSAGVGSVDWICQLRFTPPPSDSLLLCANTSQHGNTLRLYEPTPPSTFTLL